MIIPVTATMLAGFWIKSLWKIYRQTRGKHPSLPTLPPSIPSNLPPSIPSNLPPSIPPSLPPYLPPVKGIMLAGSLIKSLWKIYRQTRGKCVHQLFQFISDLMKPWKSTWNNIHVNHRASGNFAWGNCNLPNQRETCPPKFCLREL